MTTSQRTARDAIRTLLKFNADHFGPTYGCDELLEAECALSMGDSDRAGHLINSIKWNGMGGFNDCQLAATMPGEDTLYFNITRDALAAYVLRCVLAAISD